MDGTAIPPPDLNGGGFLAAPDFFFDTKPVSMRADFQSFENKMHQQLRGIKLMTDPLERATKALVILEPFLEELRTILKSLDQADIPLLIYAHKKLFPSVYAEYIFYASLYNLLSGRPIGKRQKEYFIRESERIESWFSRHESFLRYYRSNETHHDKVYFVPGMGKAESYIDLYAPLVEVGYCSRYSFIAAMGIAYQRLQKELTLLQLAASGTPMDPSVSLRWTFSKTDLTELVYALYACGVFNKGKASIKEITCYFEESLQISLGNTSVTFQEILRRKDSTVFLSRLLEAFDHYIDRVEQKNIR